MGKGVYAECCMLGVGCSWSGCFAVEKFISRGGFKDGNNNLELIDKLGSRFGFNGD